jgi:hypothetical protein
MRLSEDHLLEQKDGTARSSLALENLQQIEKMRGFHRENSEAVLRGVLGSMYTGERQLFQKVFFPRPLIISVFCIRVKPARIRCVKFI